jgi:hypothetical protein
LDIFLRLLRLFAAIPKNHPPAHFYGKAGKELRNNSRKKAQNTQKPSAC